MAGRLAQPSLPVENLTGAARASYRWPTHGCLSARRVCTFPRTYLCTLGGTPTDAPGTRRNAAAFGYAGKDPGDADRPAFPKVRVVTVSECGSHAAVDAEIGGVAGKGAGEQALARRLFSRLDPGWLLIAGRNFYNWADWRAADTGAALLWRVKSDLRLPLLEPLPDGSYMSALVSPKITGEARRRLIEAARAGEDLDRARPAGRG